MGLEAAPTVGTGIYRRKKKHHRHYLVTASDARGLLLRTPAVVYVRT